MTRMTFEALAEEGAKLSGNLRMMEGILRDTQTIQPQVLTVKANADKAGARLKLLTAAMDYLCKDCNHPRSSHDNGRAHCGEGSAVNGVVSHCTCTGWVVDL